MKYGLLICEGESECKNIGDYVQSVAQEQFLPTEVQVLEREKLHTVDSQESIKTIMNGWFMWHPSNFPPAPCIEPLFISFHVVPQIENVFFTAKTIEYLKKHAPIGARDLNTHSLLQKYGICSYFSGCLTLTLGETYKPITERKGVCFVDPYFSVGGTSKKRLYRNVMALWYLAKNYNKAKRFFDKFNTDETSFFKRVSDNWDRKICAASFYESYSKIFSDELIFSAKFIRHEVRQSDYPSNELKMQYARKLIQCYANAQLVVTSRIHCGLPCLGVETPVIFVDTATLHDGSLRSPGRLGGLKELFHVATWSNNCLYIDEYLRKVIEETGKITLKSKLFNKQDYLKLKSRLILEVKSFICSQN